MPRCSFVNVLRTVLLLFVILSCDFIYITTRSLNIAYGSSSMLSGIFPSFNDSSSSPAVIEEPKLEDVLRRAATKDGTVILTTLNEAWAAPGSVIDLFFESFRIGEGTSKLLKHLVIIALDAKAYSRCKDMHKHCFRRETEGVDFSVGEAYFMTPSYLKMTFFLYLLLLVMWFV